ncbi:heavy metal translocating P-type ATPase metal-binding domain-containing protein [Undibacterium sp. TJN19]|uniref:heavy metal translocating P-type ATPase metal-binding domain-containing protein n=1 Tax=Undibacterium sp. TJN19 TaxID=3413055 RepID=UPI003BEFA5F6
MSFPFFALLASMFPVLKGEEKVLCFHCGEKIAKTHALVITFNRSAQSVCCHGCLTILRTVEQSQLVGEYLLSRANQTLVR